jgi:hypothetical protein
VGSLAHADGVGGIDTVRRMFDGGEASLAEATRAAIHAALASGLSHVFTALAVIGALAMMTTWLVPHRVVFRQAHDVPPLRGQTRKAR